MAEYTIITHQESEIKTLGELFQRSDITALIVNWTADDLIAYNDNKARIFSKYTLEEVEDNKDKTASELLLKLNTRLLIPKDKLKREVLFTQNNQIVTNSLQPFMAEKLYNLFKDPDYKVVQDLKGNLGSVKIQNPNATVWIWSRSLGKNDSGNSPQGGFMDVTPFISSLSTNVNGAGGNFSFSLAPIVGYQDPEKGWIIKADTIKGYNSNNLGNNFVAEGNLFVPDPDNPGKKKRNNFFFSNIIKSNDLVFIRFETLKNENSRRDSNNQLVLSPKDLYGNGDMIYDMIGLVDSNIQTTNPGNSDVSINIGGRDLIKVIIDDGSYFFPLEFAQSVFYNTGQSQRDKDGLIQRNLVNGQLLTLDAYLERSIQFTLQFVIDQLSNTGLVPDSVFSGYPETVKSKKIRLEEGTSDNIYSQQRIDSEKSARSIILEIQNKYIKKEDRINISAAFNAYVNSFEIQKNVDLILIRANKISETIISTIITSKYSELKIQIDKYLESINKTQQTPFTEKNQKGVWQIIKLLIDPEIAGRRVVDSSIAEEQGSIINSIKKICQEPFVEFYTDTYGDQFYFIVRKPPFDERSIKGLLYNNVSLSNEGKNSTFSNEALLASNSIIDKAGALSTATSLVIDIEEIDVLSDSLRMNDTEIYSWYRLAPRGYLWGNGSQMTWAFLPAIYFEEYSEVWGSRPMNLVINYLPYQPYGDSNDKERQNYIEKQTFYDLKYMIDCNSYLPFTRTGTITLATGDRRIKRGNYIRYKGTGEIFYVDSVNQSYSINDSEIDRGTVLQVSRGMIEKFINGVDVQLGTSSTNKDSLGDSTTPKSVRMSYFNIINTDLEEKFFSTNDGIFSNILSSFKVNKEVFNFFLKGRQFGNY